jgi:hypothetical protein
MTTTKPTIGNMPAADLDVTFPSGETRTVNMIVLLAQVHYAEIKASTGLAVAPNGPTIAALREAYELDWFYDGPVRTWEDAALVMRHFHELCQQHIRDAG